MRADVSYPVIEGGTLNGALTMPAQKPRNVAPLQLKQTSI